MNETDRTRIDFTVAAAASEISASAERVSRFGSGAGLDRQSCFELRVVVTEALNNIVRHGRVSARRSPILVCGTIRDDGVEICIRDRGLRLGPLPDNGFPSGRAEGGRGWPIIFGWVDGVCYRTTPYSNELRLFKRRSRLSRHSC